MKKLSLQTLYYCLVMFCLAIVVTVQNLGFEKFFIGEDSGVTFMFPSVLKQLTYYMWDSLSAPGKINVTSTFGFIWSNFILFLFKIGLSSLAIPRFTYILFFLTSGLSMYYLITVLFSVFDTRIEKSLVRFAAFSAGLLYMFNHFTMQMASLPINSYHLSYMLFPLVFALFICNLQLKTTATSIFFFAVSVILFINGNPSSTLSVALFLFAYLVFFWRSITKLPTKPVHFIVISLALILLLSSYITLPIIAIGSDPYAGIGAHGDLLGSLRLNSQEATLINLFRLAGTPTWSNFSYHLLYSHNAFFIVVGYLISIIALSSFLIPGLKKIKIFLGITIVVALFVAKGSQPPFDAIFERIFLSNPVFGMFRSVYPKFSPFLIISYAILLAIFIPFVHLYLKGHTTHKKFSLIPFIAPLFILIYNLPFFLRTEIVDKAFLTRVPKEYLQIRDILTSEDSVKILSLPPAPRGSGLILKWSDTDYYVAPHPDRFFAGIPTIDSYWFFYMGFDKLKALNSWEGVEFEKKISRIIDLFPLINIKYLLVHKDFVNGYDFGRNNFVRLDGTKKANELIANLGSDPRTQLLADTSYYNLYSIPKNVSYDLFYSPSKLVFADNERAALFNLSSYQIASIPTAIVSRQDKIRYTISEDLNAPLIKINKINPTKYIVSFNSVQKPFLLVFSETYHHGWQVYAGNKNIAADKHILVNAYANGWLIDPKDVGGQTELTISFAPQRLFESGLYISTVTFIAVFFYVLLAKFVKKK